MKDTIIHTTGEHAGFTEAITPEGRSFVLTEQREAKSKLQPATKFNQQSTVKIVR